MALGRHFKKCRGLGMPEVFLEEMKSMYAHLMFISQETKEEPLEPHFR